MSKPFPSSKGEESGQVRGLPFSNLRLIRPQAWVLVLVSVLLQIVSFPVAGPLPYWRSALAWVSVAPLLVALLLSDKRGQPIPQSSSFLLGYGCGILWYAGHCYWIYQTMYLYGGLPKPVSVVILFLFALYLGLYHALFALLVVRLRRTRASVRGALVLSPCLWVAVELARARITGFPWDLLGNSQVDNLLVTRLAPLGGAMLISFVVAAVNACAAAPFLLAGKRVRWIAVAALVLASAAMLAGIPLRTSKPINASYEAVMMQENLSVGVTARGVRALSPAEELATFSAMTLRPGADAGGIAFELPAGAASQLVIWPEAPSHFQSDDPYLKQALGELARKTAAPVIAGDIGLDLDPSLAKGYLAYDSAQLFDASGVERGRYDKIHLVPWGEYVPFKQFFAFAQKLTAGAGDMDPGHLRTVFVTGGHSYGVFICYESIFGDEVREFVKNGAEVLVNISDDGWFGDTGAPWQHLNMARMRAIENDRYVLRSTNTGVTTAIDPRGQMAEQAPRHVRGAFAFAFGFRTGQTFYTRFGDWFAYLCAAVAIAGVSFSFLQRVDGGGLR